MLVRCASCGRHVRDVETACPFCSRPRARGKHLLAGAAGAAAMTIGLGCAYGMPEPGRDASADRNVADVTVSGDTGAAADALAEGAADVATDAPADAPKD